MKEKDTSVKAPGGVNSFYMVHSRRYADSLLVLEMARDALSHLDTREVGVHLHSKLSSSL